MLFSETRTNTFYEEFEDTKGVIRIRISKKNRQHNGQKKKYKRTKHTHKTKDRITRTPLKIGGERRCSGRVSSSCSTSGTRRVNLVTNPVISHDEERTDNIHILLYIVRTWEKSLQQQIKN